MPVFTYTAVDPSGKSASGTLPADNRAAALEQVTKQGLMPVSVE